MGKLTKAQMQTLQEMASCYGSYYQWRPKSAQQLVEMGLAEVVPERRPHMSIGRRITPAGRAALHPQEARDD